MSTAMREHRGRELLPLLRLAVPVVLAEVGWMSMGLVDTMMVGRLGPAAIAATGLGSGVFSAVAIFGMGLMLGLDPLVSHAFGAGRPDEGRQWLYQGVWVAVGAAPFVMAVTWLAFMTLDWWGLHPEIAAPVEDYLRVIATSALPLLLYAAFRRYLQGMHIVGPIMFALISANLVNAGANWVLIYGNAGMPALGVAGAAWATTISRVYLAVFLFMAIRDAGTATVTRARPSAGTSPSGGTRPSANTPPSAGTCLSPCAPQLGRDSLAFNPARSARLVRLGLPAASQVTLEVGVFAVATALAGRLDPISAGAHQIALNIASLAFMVPLGIASAAAVRVGFRLGMGDTRGAVLAGWTALAGGGLVMLTIGLVFYLWPEPLLRAFTTDPGVIELGVGLLAIAAAFQLFDGTQGVATGVLRGAGDTRTPMIVNVIGHWVLGLPIAYILCFVAGWGVIGLWVGLSIGLVVVAIALLALWIVHTKNTKLDEAHEGVTFTRRTRS